MVLIDTSVWIDFFNGKIDKQTDKLNELLVGENLIMGDIILTEILQGFKSDSDFNTAKKVLAELPCYSISNKGIAIKSAENFRFLKKKGITVRKTIDMLIATFCIENSIPLLHNDRDFQPIKKHLGLICI